MERIGLVFSGGGGKGAYEFGVWKALHELELDKMITGVAGTSIGGLNGVLFAIRDFDTCAKVWNYAQVDPRPIPPILKNKMTLAIKNKIKDPTVLQDIYHAFDNWMHQGFLSSKKLDVLIKKEVDFAKLPSANCDAYIACHDYVRQKAIYFHLNEEKDIAKLKKIMRATASIPVIFSPVIVDNHVFGDGGMSDNTPIKPLYDNGFTKIIVILLKNEEIDLSRFPQAKLFILCPGDDLGNFVNGSLNFYHDAIERRIKQGYDEGKAFFLAHSDIFLFDDVFIA